jgi:hypothetical protein
VTNRPNWSAPPVATAETVNIPWQVVPGDTLRLWIVSPVLVGVMTHYNGARTLACTAGVNQDGEIVQCWHERCKETQRWQGWIAAAHVHSPNVRLLSVTPSLVAQCRLLASTIDLRGMRLDVWRATASPHSRMCGTIWEPPAKPALPASPDIRAALVRMWDAPLRETPIRQVVDEQRRAAAKMDRENDIPTGEES